MIRLLRHGLHATFPALGGPGPVPAGRRRGRRQVQRNGLVIDVEPGRFEDMVVTALDGLPEELGELMSNVAVTVEHGAGPRGLRALPGPPAHQPHVAVRRGATRRVTIYRQAICAICRTESEVADQVRRTVIHEIAHHFGIDDRRLRELGW